DARGAVRAAAGGSAPAVAFDGADSATAVLFQAADGTRRAWRTTIASRAEPYGFESIVDAATGLVLRRTSLTLRATALAFDNHPGARLGGRQQLVDLAAKGWLPAGATRLSGNNAHAYTDVDGSFSPSSSEEVGPDGGGNWNYPLSVFDDQPLGCSTSFPCTWISDLATGGFSWQANRRQAATQAFHFANSFHDHLAEAPVGFTEAAGNYQQVNTSGEGQGGDPVEIHALLGANTLRVGGELVGLPSADNVDNAFTFAGRDGQSAHLGLFLTHDPAGGDDRFIAADYDEEADIVYHEYTHALQFRLLVDAQGNTTLADSYQSLAMAEGSADWYANDYLVAQGVRVDTPVDGEIREGDYATRGAGIRTQPIDCAVGSRWPACQGGTRAPSRAGRGGFTFGDLSRVSDVDDPHRDGEVWAETLWDLRGALGSRVALGLVTRAMELSPAGPTFLEERNAILQADVVNFSGIHRRAIWAVFARRGMGYFAGMTQGAFPVSPDNAHDPTGELVVEDFQMAPLQGTPAATVRGRAVDDQTGAPLAGVRISLATYPSERSAVTGPDGRYELTGLAAGSYRLIYAAAPQSGYDFEIGDPLRILPGQRVAHRDWRLRLDWASVARGGSVASFTGTDYTPFGCGPDAAIDRSYAGWSSDALDAGGNPFTPEIVIALPEPVDVSGFGLLPSETCGDDLTASARDYRIETSPDAVHWRVADRDTLAVEDRYRLHEVALRAAARDVRFVRLTLLSTQLAAPCAADAQQSGCYFADITELEVYGR
ncbi:MAG: extracellular elastinolytic metalloproteinase, partial [Solirubrobacteraceae bacterium]|nr:extracellular elastinolytic metalloproteinase [Solirubrobacteraceae bacterium]